MAGNEEHLFRQFRLPWVPNWVPDWLEAALRTSATWKTLAITILTVSASYLGWKFLETRSGQEAVDLVAWESRLDNANPWEIPVLLDSLFQIQNDAAMALGVRQLASPDPQRRQLAGIALRDADLQWSRWSPDLAAKQRERAVRWLSQVVAGLHAPEQAIAVELARQALRQPTALDPSVRDSLLANSRALFAQAHPAHTAAVRWGETNNVQTPLTESELDRWNGPPHSGDTNNVHKPQTDHRIAGSERFTPRGTDSSNDNNDGNRFRPAGFSRRTDDPLVPNSRASSPRAPQDSNQGASQIPLYDDAGRLIEVQVLDPTDSTTPGGLIPVGMSNTNRSSNPGQVDFHGESEVESKYRDPASGTSSDEFNRIGGSRVDRPGLVATEPVDAIPGRTNTSPDDEMRKRELAAAFQLRAQSVAAIRKSRTPATPQRTDVVDSGTEIVTSEPQLTPPPASLRTEVPTMPVATAPRAIPKNPYRTGDTTATDSETLLSIAEPAVEIDWRPMSHIEVMFRLRDEDPGSARQALKELERRGFNSSYIAVARRLTSPNPREREQLILDLVASHQIEPMPFLRWLANDPDPSVQSMAINALEMLQASVRERGAEALNEAVWPR